MTVIVDIQIHCSRRIIYVTPIKYQYKIKLHLVEFTKLPENEKKIAFYRRFQKT